MNLSAPPVLIRDCHVLYKNFDRRCTDEILRFTGKGGVFWSLGPRKEKCVVEGMRKGGRKEAERCSSLRDWAHFEEVSCKVIPVMFSVFTGKGDMPSFWGLGEKRLS